MKNKRAMKIVDCKAKIDDNKIVISLFKMFNDYSIEQSDIEIWFTENKDKLCTIQSTKEALEDIVAIINAARETTNLK